MGRSSERDLFTVAHATAAKIACARTRVAVRSFWTAGTARQEPRTRAFAWAEATVLGACSNGRAGGKTDVRARLAAASHLRALVRRCVESSRRSCKLQATAQPRRHRGQWRATRAAWGGWGAVGMISGFAVRASARQRARTTSADFGSAASPRQWHTTTTTGSSCSGGVARRGLPAIARGRASRAGQGAAAVRRFACGRLRHLGSALVLIALVLCTPLFALCSANCALGGALSAWKKDELSRHPRRWQAGATTSDVGMATA